MGLNAATLLDQGHRAVKELSMAKVYAVQAGVRAVDRAIQTFGTVGFTNEMGLTEAYHALRLINVADGPNEILHRTIFQRLLARRPRPGRTRDYESGRTGHRTPSHRWTESFLCDVAADR